MSDTTQKPPAQANGAGSLTVAMSAVVVLNYAMKTRWQIEIPADVGVAIGTLLTAVAHGAQMLFLAWRHR